MQAAVVVSIAVLAEVTHADGRVHVIEELIGHSTRHLDAIITPRGLLSLILFLFVRQQRGLPGSGLSERVTDAAGGELPYAARRLFDLHRRLCSRSWSGARVCGSCYAHTLTVPVQCRVCQSISNTITITRPVGLQHFGSVDVTAQDENITGIIFACVLNQS